MYSQEELKKMVLGHKLLGRFPKEESFAGFPDGNLFLGSKKNAIRLHEKESGKSPVYFYRAEFEADSDSSLSKEPLPSEGAAAKTEQAEKPKGGKKPKPAGKEEAGAGPKPNEKAPDDQK